MNLNEFIATHSNVTPNADIVERWHSRIVGGALHTSGAAGAEAYLGQFGRSIKAPKVVALARCAEINGFPAFATRMWQEAYFLTTGERVLAEAGCVTAMVPKQPEIHLKDAFGQQPQLLVAIAESEVDRYLRDDRYGMQEKKEGRRALIRNRSKLLSAGNKKGLVCGVPPWLLSQLGCLDLPDFLNDGEDVAREATYHAFDLLDYGNADLRGIGVGRRHDHLLEYFSGVERSVSSFRIVPMARGTTDKMALRDRLRSAGAEGFVFKLLDAPYAPGDHHSTQVKFQFRALGAFIVGDQNGSKSSVEIFVNGASGGLRSMGGLKLPERLGILPPGSIVEVSYRHCHTGLNGKLAEAFFVEQRFDVSPEDCVEGKLRIRAEADDE